MVKGALPLKGAVLIDQKRATNILPAYHPKREIFKMIRKIFGETGRISDWTRTWKGPVVVDLSPSKIDMIYGPFKSREEALKWERLWVEIRLQAGWYK